MQNQTFTRAVSSLSSFNVYGETDDVAFLNNKLKKPVVITLKKNNNILRKWKNLLSSSGYCAGRPLVIVDDEADAASLNTLINKKRISTINSHLSEIKNLSPSSLFIQVTATPQSLFLQTNLSGWRPEFTYYFKPDRSYIGGDFIYSSPKPFSIQITGENELDMIKDEDSYIPDGLKNALLTFLVTCAHFNLNSISNCNFLIHPSVRIADHEVMSKVIGEHLNEMLLAISDDSEDLITPQLLDVYNELKVSKPDLEDFDDIILEVSSIIDNQTIKVIIMNSTSSYDLGFASGFNIIVGGNSLGRGVTIPKLQTVYYCRKSKTPQADTFWQHSRMFGYDRDRSLLRVFLPQSLYNLFSELNVANKILINQILNPDGLDVQIIYPKNIRPTRKSVVDNKSLNLIMGGVDYFSSNPRQDNLETLNTLLKSYDEKLQYHHVSLELVYNILKNVGDQDLGNWNSNRYANAIKNLASKRLQGDIYLILRKNRKISRNTGTLLTPNDRSLGKKFPNDTVITLYQVEGSVDNGWEGKPFYIPNIKLPEGLCIYDISE